MSTLMYRYEQTWQHAREHDVARNFVLAFQCHALCEGYARAIYDMLPVGSPEGGLWRTKSTYHANSCENIRKLLRSDDPLAATRRDSDEVERAVWSVARSARALMGNLRQDVLDMLPTAFKEGLEADLKALDEAQLKQRKERHEV